MDQKSLNRLIKRRHPKFKENEAHWQFLNACYEGGRTWFDNNIFRYHKEGDVEYKNRVERAYRFNHSKEIVDLVSKYIFKMEITRREDPPEEIKKFWDRCTRNGLSIDDYARQIAKKTSIFGRMWIVVDSTKSDDSQTRADDEANDDRVFSYMVEPYNALDMSYDEDGELNWILLAEYARDDSDPFESGGDVLPRFRLWNRTDWYLFEAKARNDGSGEFDVTLVGSGKHDLGVVPVFAADSLISDDPYVTPALISDTAYLDRAVANYLSNLDAIIQDQTFSQLAMPAQGLMPGENGYDKLLEMGTKRVFLYDGESGAAPFYLSPDVKQASLVIEVISKIINEIYHSVGVAGERTKQDNSQGIDNSSGVAKGYDFERVNALLAAKADSLELIENRLVNLVLRWHGQEELDESLVSYPDNFDVRGIYDEFEIAARLSVIEAPDEMRREQMRTMVEKLFPKLKRDLKEKMIAEIEKNWPPKVEDFGGVAGGSTNTGGASSNVSAEGKKSTALDMVN